MPKMFLVLMLGLFIICQESAHSRVNFESGNINSVVVNALNRWKRQNKRIDGAYIRDGRAIVHAGKEVVCSDMGYFGPSGSGPKNLCKKMRELAAKDGSIRAIAVTKSNNYIIVSNKTVFYSKRSLFLSMGITQKIRNLMSSRKVIGSISFFPNNGWLITASGKAYFQKVPLGVSQAIQTAEYGEEVIKYAYSHPWKSDTYKWMLFTGQNYWGNVKNIQIHNQIKSMITSQKRLEGIAFAQRGWVLFSNYFNTLSHRDKFTRMEFDVAGSHMLARMQHHKVVGLSFAIVDGDKIVSRTYGFTNHTKRNRTNAFTYFPAASISKAFFSYGVLKADELGYLNIDSSIGRIARSNKNSTLDKWYDSLPQRNNKPYQSRANAATLRSLLSHTGGMSVHGIGLYKKDDMRSLKDIIMGKRGRTKVEPTDRVSSLFKYSGGGYSLVESALPLETGVGLNTFFAKHIFRPLGMSNSTFGYLHPSREKYMAQGHQANFSSEPIKYCPGKGAGGLITTSRDYAMFLWSLMNEGRSFTTKRQVVDLFSIKEMMRPAGTRNSSNRSCSNTNPCTNTSERCLINKCVNPIVGWRKWQGLGIMHSTSLASMTERGRSVSYPTESDHGGTQTGYRNRFFLKMTKKKALVILANSVGDWTDSAGNGRGVNPLIWEIRAAFTRHYSY